MIIIGLTGGIASGKTTITNLLKKKKFAVHDSDSVVKDTTVEELEYLQKLSDKNYQQFIKDVAQSRNVNLKDHKTWADGKIFLGNEALKLKLVDQIGSQTEAREKIRELAKVGLDQEIKFVTPTRPSSLMRFLSGNEEPDSEGQEFSAKLADFLHKTCSKFLQKKVDYCLY